MGRKTKDGVELKLAGCTVREWRPGDAPSPRSHGVRVLEVRSRAPGGVRVRVEPALGPRAGEGRLHAGGQAPEGGHEGGPHGRLLSLRPLSRMSPGTAGSISHTGARLRVLAAALTFSIGGSGITACPLTN